MATRDIFLEQFRGDAFGEKNPNNTAENVFQNEVLRPILKLQNDLFVASFQNYLRKNKKDYALLTIDRKIASIENAIQKDIKYRNALKGMIIGLFTLEEYNAYVQNSSSLNKRMMNMLIERLKSQIQLFDIQEV